MASSRSNDKKIKVGIVGFGELGQYLWDKIEGSPDFEIVFVWNRSLEKLNGKVPEAYILNDLDNIDSKNVDLIVEVAHPSITKDYGVKFLQKANYMIGSPTALADQSVEDALRAAATAGPYGLYIPVGAFWGADDVRKMADRGTLKGLTITMAKYPTCFKLTGRLEDEVKSVLERKILYEGSVRGLCPLAPNNVNTMAVGAIAAHNLGFDQVKGRIVADPSLKSHIVEIEIEGPGSEADRFTVKTTRINPSQSGSVTGKQTYASFYSSLLGARNKGKGVHLC